MKWLFSIPVAVMAAIFPVLLYGLGLLQPWDDASKEWQISWYASQGAQGVALVHVITFQDDGTNPFPPQRLDYALVMNAIAPVSPKVVALAVPLNGDDTVFPMHDQQLDLVARKFHQVIVAVEQSGQLSLPTPPKLLALQGKALSEVPALQVAEWPGRGAVHMVPAPRAFSPDADGVLRQIPLLFRFEEKLYPSFGLVTAGAAQDVDLLKGTVTAGSTIVFPKNSSKDLHQIPVDAAGRLRLSTPVKAGIHRYDAWDVIEKREKFLRGELDQEPFPEFRGGVVLIGLESKEYYPPLRTSYGEITSLQLQAQNILQLMNGGLSVDLADGLVIVWMLLSGFGMVLLAANGKGWLGLPLSLLLAVLPFLLVKSLVPLVTLLVGTVTAFVSALVLRFVFSEE